MEKYVFLYMPYYKQGDDLHFFLEKAEGDVSTALRMYAEMLNDASNLIDNINNRLEEYDATDKVEIEADTHMIMISGPANILQKLVDEGLVQEDPFADEYDEEEYEEDYEDIYE